MRLVLKRKATLAEVAAVASVSVATVSKALNGRSDVSPATRVRVHRAAEGLGYRSVAERATARFAPHVLALCDGIHTMYTATILDGIVSAAAAQGVEVVVRSGVRASAGPGHAYARTLTVGCAGIIAVTYGMRDLKLLGPDISLPIVIVDPSEVQSADWMTIGATNWTGARSATEHLIELGHRRIGWVGGPPGSEAATERRHGYRAALQSAGLPFEDALETGGDFTIDSGREAAARLLTTARRPTALVAANDELAIGAMDAARAFGLRVPQDLSVTGFDDTPQASLTSPKLTTVRQPLAEMGGMAVRMILDRSVASAESKHIQLATRLVVRESTASPP